MRLRKLGVELAVMAAIVIALTLLGPFGSYIVPLAPRLLQWALFVFGGYAFFRPVIWAGHIVSDHSGIPGPLSIALACIMASMPTTLLVTMLLNGGSLGTIALAELFERYGQVLIVGAVATLVQVALARPGRTVPGPGPVQLPADVLSELPVAAAQTVDCPVTALPAGPRLADRLPLPPGGQILALSHEDHYVRVHHTGGTTLLLMRISDAIAELEGVEGERIHRSWWVARAAVAGRETRGRATSLRLTNGLEAPVARTMVAPLRDQGWF